MSHITNIDVAIKDLTCLEKAAASLGLIFKRDKLSFKMYSNRRGQCSHVIAIPNALGAHEIGVIDEGDGVNYSLVWDEAGAGAMKKVVGEDCEKLNQAYSTHVTVQDMIMNGYTIQQHFREEDGTISLLATRY